MLTCLHQHARKKGCRWLKWGTERGQNPCKSLYFCPPNKYANLRKQSNGSNMSCFSSIQCFHLTAQTTFACKRNVSFNHLVWFTFKDIYLFVGFMFFMPFPHVRKVQQPSGVGHLTSASGAGPAKPADEYNHRLTKLVGYVFRSVLSIVFWHLFVII